MLYIPIWLVRKEQETNKFFYTNLIGNVISGKFKEKLRFCCGGKTHISEFLYQIVVVYTWIPFFVLNFEKI